MMLLTRPKLVTATVTIPRPVSFRASVKQALGFDLREDEREDIPINGASDVATVVIRDCTVPFGEKSQEPLVLDGLRLHGVIPFKRVNSTDVECSVDWFETIGRE